MFTTPDLENVQRVHHDLSKSMRVRRGAVAEAKPVQALPLELFSTMPEYAPSLEEILDKYLRNFTGRLPKSRSAQALNVIVILSPEQLIDDVHLPVRVPLFHICQRCGGSGRAGFFGCEKCEGAGIIEEIRTLDILIPAHTPQGAALPLSLEHLGIENLHLNVQVAVHA
jgi:hypothetical protein